MDIDRAIKNPAGTFATPEALSKSSELTTEEARDPIAMERSAAAIASSGRRGHATKRCGREHYGRPLGRVTSSLSRIDADLKRVSNSSG
jgi:hypothetical protein